MKSKINIILILLLTLSFSCSLEDVNVDPNTFPTAGDAQILSSSIGYLGYIIETDLNYSESYMWSQYYTWGIGVAIGNPERFVQAGTDNDGYWQRAYSNSLADLDYIDKNSSSAAYRGISQVLKAYIFQGLVDHFGDIPFTEALSGAIDDGSILTPNYDNAETIVYPALVSMLDSALLNLSLSEDDVEDDDFIYQGDATDWIKFANSLKLRILMRTSETDPKGTEITNLIASGTFIETAADMPFIPYTGSSGDQNPMYARAEWGVGNFYFASNGTLNVLQDLNDPRRFAFYDTASTGTSAGNLRGIDQGTIDDEPFTAPASDYSLSSAYAYGDMNPVILMSPWEVWFLRAEAAARYGTADDDVTALTTAIQSNFTYTGVGDATAYIASLDYASAATLDEQLDIIGVQKWISMNGTQEDEGWIEARRFDRPASRLFTNGIWQTPPLSVLSAGEFPSAWLYPASEKSFNPNSPAQRTVTDKIFWDN